MKYQTSFTKNRSLCSFLIVGFWCFVVTASLLISQGSAYAAQVTLAWDASAEAAGYKIYYGTTSNNYTSVVDVANKLTYTFEDLPDGNTYYFAATAYDASDLESDYSTEISYDTTSQTEILWRNVSTGENVVWYMDGVSMTGWASLPTVSDTNWIIIARSDFNGDGKTDILWRNTSTGVNVVWYMDGVSMTGWASLPTVATTWAIVGLADFNGDDKTDILWRNTSTGVNVVWYMDGVSMTGWASPPTVATTWAIVGLADFNGDGKTDILWRNTTSGANAVWYMDGISMTGWASLPTVAELNWKIIGK
jgi:hypothetical protein